MQGRSAGAPAHLSSRTALGRCDDAKMGEGHAFRTLWTRSKHGQTSDTREITASGAVEREEVYVVGFLGWECSRPAFLVELYGAYRVSARLSGRAKGTRGSVSVTVNRREELAHRPAPCANFDHGSLFEAAPGARQFPGTAESPTKFHFMPIKMRMQGGGLHAQ